MKASINHGKKRLSGTTIVIVTVIITLLVIGGYFVFKKFSEGKKASLEFGTSPDYSAAYKPTEVIEESTDVNVFDTKTNPFEEE